ncbi:MAG: hypothetical protein QW734_07195 [Candidatus Bathyarchaeia archaeon]
MLYEVSELGIAISGVISTTLLFLLFCQVAYNRKKGDRWQSIALISLFYFISWLIAILAGQSIFNLNLTPKLSLIAIFSILIPYFGNLSYYLVFEHPPINVFGPLVSIMKKFI